MTESSGPDESAEPDEQFDDAQERVLPLLEAAAQRFMGETGFADDYGQQARSLRGEIQRFLDEADAAGNDPPQTLQLFRIAQQFADDATAQASSAPSLEGMLRQAFLAVEAAIRERFADAGPQAIHGSGGITLPKLSVAGVGRVSDGDVATATEDAQVTVLEEMGVGKLVTKAAREGIAGLSPAQVLTLTLVWIFMVGGPVVQQALPPEIQSVLTNEYGTLGVALAVTFWILANRKR